jgi:hypothetical protein
MAARLRDVSVCGHPRFSLCRVYWSSVLAKLNVQELCYLVSNPWLPIANALASHASDAGTRTKSVKRNSRSKQGLFLLAIPFDLVSDLVAQSRQKGRVRFCRIPAKQSI